MSDQPGNPYGSTPGEGNEPNPNPYGQPPGTPYGQPSYGQPPSYGNPNPYGEAPQNPYGQQPYGGGTYQGGVSAPNHPSATTSMVLGIIGLASVVICCGIGLVLSPFAWRGGSKALREIEAANGAVRGADQARAGQVMGIIGTVLLILAVLALVASIGLFFLTDVSTTQTQEAQPVG